MNDGNEGTPGPMGRQIHQPTPVLEYLHEAQPITGEMWAQEKRRALEAHQERNGRAALRLELPEEYQGFGLWGYPEALTRAIHTAQQMHETIEEIHRMTGWVPAGIAARAAELPGGLEELRLRAIGQSIGWGYSYGLTTAAERDPHQEDKIALKRRFEARHRRNRTETPAQALSARSGDPTASQGHASRPRRRRRR